MLDKVNETSSGPEHDYLRVSSPDGNSEDQPSTEPSDDGGEKGKGGENTDKRPFWRRRPILTILGIVVLIAAIVAAVLWYLHARHFEGTDDAFIDSRPVSVSAEVTGNITDVPVTDNQIVHPGDLLVRIDARNYQASVDQAQAQIEQAQAQYANADAQVQAQKSQVDQTERQTAEALAALQFSKDENNRYQQLAQSGYGTVQRAQQAASDLLQKQASYDAAQSSQSAAEKQITVLKAQRKGNESQIDSAKAQKETADANLTRTEIHATVESRVTRLTGAPGLVATAGQALMVLVPLDMWVTANFKETQLTDMRPGQPVDIEIDAYGRTYPGKVDSIQAGSGTAFSLLPAQNATGNYVKVVQRIPVKLVFDQRPDVELGPGMSVVPRVTVR